MNRLQFTQKLKETFPRFSAFKLLNEENDQFEISFIRLFRIPKKHDVAAFEMSPTDAFDFIIN